VSRALHRCGLLAILGPTQGTIGDYAAVWITSGLPTNRNSEEQQDMG
jgi:hypothetical protein